MNKLITGCIAVTLITTLSGCSLFKKGSRKKETPQTTAVTTADSSGKPVADTIAMGTPAVADSAVKGIAAHTPVSAETKMLIGELMPLWDSHTDYKTFNGKASVHVETPDDKKDFTATIRMEKDSKIWVSIVAFGLFEAVRAVITPDTIIIIDRLHKEARVVPFKEAGKLLPVAVEFATLQQLILGDVLHPAQDKPTGAEVSASAISLSAVAEKYLQQLTFRKNDSTLDEQRLQLIAASGNGPLLVMKYDDYSMQGNRRFAKTRSIHVQDTAGNTNINMGFNKVDFDQDLDFSFSIPAKYKRK